MYNEKHRNAPRIEDEHPKALAAHKPANIYSRRTFLALAAGATTTAVLAGCGARSTQGAAAPSSAADTTADALATIRERATMTFGTEGTWSPWTFHNENDELTGYDVEVARAIAERLGATAQFAEGEWDGLFAGVDAGRYDSVANGVSVTSERAEKYDFTTPYAYNRTAIIVRADDTSIASFEDLAGKTTANTISSAYAEVAEGYGATVTGVDDLAQTLDLLLDGRIDATLNDEVVFYDYVAEHPEAQVKIAALSNDAVPVALPVPKDDAHASLLAAMNEAIGALRADGTLAQLSEQFFGVDISEA